MSTLIVAVVVLLSVLQGCESFDFFRCAPSTRHGTSTPLQPPKRINPTATAAVVLASSFVYLAGPSASLAVAIEDFDSTPAKATNEFEYAQQFNDAAQV